MDELSHCINQLEAEIDGSACHRRPLCNGEVSDSSDSSRIDDKIIGCMKCHKDNAYEQVTTHTTIY